MKPKLPRGTLDRLWADPKNWNDDGNYFCAEDPRWIVPSRSRDKTRWHYNEAHRDDFTFLVRRAPVMGICIIMLLGMVTTFWMNPEVRMSWLLTPGLMIGGLLASYLFQRRFASTERYEDCDGVE